MSKFSCFDLSGSRVLTHEFAGLDAEEIAGPDRGKVVNLTQFRQGRL